MMKVFASLSFLVSSFVYAGGGGLPQTLAYECKGQDGTSLKVLQNDNYFFGSIAFEVDESGNSSTGHFLKFKGAYDEGDFTVFPFGLRDQTLKLFLPIGQVSNVEKVSGTYFAEEVDCEGVGFRL